MGYIYYIYENCDAVVSLGAIAVEVEIFHWKVGLVVVRRFLINIRGFSTYKYIYIYIRIMIF